MITLDKAILAAFQGLISTTGGPGASDTRDIAKYAIKYGVELYNAQREYLRENNAGKYEQVTKK